MGACLHFATALALAVMTIAQPIQAANSLSQNDITWTFDKDYETGQFVNGEWWVVGPVTIISISPEDPDLADDVDIHGSMVNPVKDQHGLDSRSKGNRYIRDLNIARQLPYTIQPGTSLMSAVSHEVYTSGHISKAAILTVLTSAPPAGCFRPPYYGAYKPLFNVSALNYSVLRKLTPTPNSPTPMSLANGEMKHVLIDLFTGGASANSEFKANSLGPHYGREIAKASSRAALALQLDYTDAQKRDLLVEVVQRGIDLYGALTGGYMFTADGGHNHGRKITMFIAAKTLGDAHMLSLCDGTANRAFQEDGQHDFVHEGWTLHPPENYGIPEWGADAYSRLDRLEVPWDYTGYRFNNGSGNTGTVLAVTLMGGRAEWNHEAFFRYTIERYWPIESVSTVRGINSANGIPRFTHEMWNAYFSKEYIPGQIDPLPVEPIGLRVTDVPE
jgi:hypothetical protein